jgi:DNA-binding CsgD family transcriptional regulator
MLRGRHSECEVFDDLLGAVRDGRSGALVVCGEAGVGKTALLEYAIASASDLTVARALGVESEMELPFAGLHQLCAPMLGAHERLAVPQRQALGIVFGLEAGPPPERFLVGLAVLSLLSEVAEERPLLCVIDDAQWLDRASAQALAFVARRLLAESVAVVFASRELTEELRGLRQLVVEGLRDADASELLQAAARGPLDERVRDRIVAETRGNPLALLELPRGMTPAELAGGFGLPGAMSVPGRIEASYQRQLDALPAETRRLMQLAAADPTGEPTLIRRGAQRLGLGVDAAAPAADAGLLEFGVHVRFRHPLVRSAAYRSASVKEREDAHRALWEVTDPEVDPDRHAWHRAHATPEPDEDVASELERSADRAQARGGLAAAAAFLQRAAELSPEPARRAQRLLAAAEAKRDAGAVDEALGLLVAAEAGPRDALRSAGVERLRGQIAFDRGRYDEATPLLVGAARRLEPLNASSARETHLEALVTAMWVGGPETPGALREAAEAARAAPPGPDPPRAVDLLLDAFAVLLTDGYPPAAPTLRGGLELFLALKVGADEDGGRLWRAGSRASSIAALELWDYESWHRSGTDQVVLARDTGALVHLQHALRFLGFVKIYAGELNAAALLFEEGSLVAEATNQSPIAAPEMMLAAWRGQERSASRLIEDTLRDLSAGGRGTIPAAAAYSSSVLYNGLGRHDAARDAAWQAFDSDPVAFRTLIVSEVAEAASRTGDLVLVKTTLDWLSERTRAVPAEWALGIEARIRALLSEGDAAETLYRESIEHLGRTRVRAELARSRLLYGEWLRRENRRVDAREQLRTAHEMLVGMGVDGFADRARRELLATGERARKRTVETREDLTPQEAQIARLARDGLSNPEIGARLFISPRTVEYHLHKVFTKLDISSRNQLDGVLPRDAGDDRGVGTPTDGWAIHRRRAVS